VTGRNTKIYDDTSVEKATKGSLESARVIAPIVTALLNPKSVIDFGCGHGAWLKAFKENGIRAIQGVDGPWVDRSRLLIDSTFFRSLDLCHARDLYGQWDLAICLEVAEHLPKNTSEPLVQILSSVAQAVLFSAAVPGQSGRGHINEQWPAYWRQLFERRGFRRLDPIRRHVWQDSRVDWWYRQNIFLYISEHALAASEALRSEQELACRMQDEWIHMRVLSSHTSLRGVLRELPRAAWRSLKHRVASVG
jgi:SAM-dependent methyltransferase